MPGLCQEHGRLPSRSRAIQTGGQKDLRMQSWLFAPEQRVLDCLSLIYKRGEAWLPVWDSNDLPSAEVRRCWYQRQLVSESHSGWTSHPPQGQDSETVLGRAMGP